MLMALSVYRLKCIHVCDSLSYLNQCILYQSMQSCDQKQPDFKSFVLNFVILSLLFTSHIQQCFLLNPGNVSQPGACATVARMAQFMRQVNFKITSSLRNNAVICHHTEEF